MTQLALSIEMTVNDGNSNVSLQSVKTSLGDDVTDRFVEYCNNNSLPIGSQAEIESAAIAFSNDNSSWLP